VLRAAPCLLGLFSVVTLIDAQHRREHPRGVDLATRPWCRKTQPTFADAVHTVRRLFWHHTIIPHPTADPTPTRKPTPPHEPWLSHLRHAA